MSGGEFAVKVYDRNGMPISIERWGELSRDFETNCQVARDPVGGYVVSTVWLGLDHGWYNDRPIIFETMVFHDLGDWVDFDCKRYCTEEEALAGHHEMLTLVRATVQESETVEEPVPEMHDSPTPDGKA